LDKPGGYLEILPVLSRAKMPGTNLRTEQLSTGSEQHLLKLTTNKNRIFMDVFCLAILIFYLGVIFVFSSFFYLATEDYEAVTAVEAIRSGQLIGKSTGWPYTPLAAYLFYLYSLGFGNDVLGFRLVACLLILLATVPIYLILRTICEPFMAFALTLLCHSLSTFPHPRLEYFIEGAVASFAIYFGVKFLQTSRRIYVYCCAVFAFLAFASRGHPNSSALLLLLPSSLLIVDWIIRQNWNQNFISLRDTAKYIFADIYNFITARDRRARLFNTLAVVVLTTFSFIWVMIFLRKVVYRRLLIEYSDVNDLVSTSVNVNRTFWAWILVIGFAGIYIAIPPGNGRGGSRIHKLRTLSFAFLPFAVVGSLFVLLAAWVGYSWQELMFFIFPVDIIADHRAVGRIGGIAAGILPAFLGVTATTLYFYLNGWLQKEKAKIALFLLLLTPATFARFFPTYNMLYLGVFPIAVFLGCLLPSVMNYFGATGRRLTTALAIFFILYSAGSNYLLLVHTQLQDLNTGRLVKLEQGAANGIFVEQDVFELFEDIRRQIERYQLPKEGPNGFLSSRYVKLTPLIYQWPDSFAGENLMIQLGKIWSYDDVIKIDGVESSDVFNWPGLVYRWRQAAVERLEQSNTNVIVMSLYDEKVLEEELMPSDPFKEYLRQNFRITDVIEPTMRFYRRSIFPEGAVILRRNP
jgi:hypothetical protein